MATIEFRTHSIKDDDKHGTIGTMGKIFARSVGLSLMRGRRFDRFCVSAVPRTMQTLEALAEGAGWDEFEKVTSVAPLYVHSPDLELMWSVCRDAQRSGHDVLAAAFALDEDLVEETSQTIVQLFNEWVLSLPRDAHVLVIGHSPHLEFLMYGLTRVRMAALRECQGFRVHTRVLQDDVTVNVVVETKAEDLDPSALRRELFEIPTAPDTVRGYQQLWEPGA